MTNNKIYLLFLIVILFSISGLKGFERFDDKDVIELDSKREIFIDYYLIDKLESTRIIMHHPHDEGVVMYFDKPWEGIFAGMCKIIKDGDLNRAYYRSRVNIKDPKHEVTCYAESKDGINWEKPVLGLHKDLNGSFENNIMLANADKNVNHNFSPFLDKNPYSKPDQKYKALGGGAGLVPYVSSDGIH